MGADLLDAVSRCDTVGYVREDQDRQISLRLSSSLYEALEKRAEDEDLTMAQVIRRSLRRELTREKKR